MIEKALAFHKPNPKDGLEIGGMCGAILAAALTGTCIVFDGLISTAAGLICPEIKGHQTNNISKEELILVEQIIKETVDLQGFRVDTVTKRGKGLIAEIRPDARYSIRCGTCNAPAKQV